MLTVAVLVPTTVLAQQHFETFGAPCALPVTVEMLSRFAWTKVQGEILRKLLRAKLILFIGYTSADAAGCAVLNWVCDIDEELRLG